MLIITIGKLERFAAGKFARITPKYNDKPAVVQNQFVHDSDQPVELVRGPGSTESRAAGAGSKPQT